MKKCLQSSSRDSEVVCVLRVPLIGGVGGCGGSKEVVHGGVRQQDLCPLSGVGGVVAFTRGAEIRS